jgi:hypothetical protein
MVMLVRVPVEAFQRTAEFQFLDFTHLDKYFQISVNRPKTDPGKTMTYHSINFVSTRMGMLLSQLFKNYFALLGHPNVFFLQQVFTSDTTSFHSDPPMFPKLKRHLCQV